jgi:hypothetical protein
MVITPLLQEPNQVSRSWGLNQMNVVFFVGYALLKSYRTELHHRSYTFLQLLVHRHVEYEVDTGLYYNL